MSRPNPATLSQADDSIDRVVSISWRQHLHAHWMRGKIQRLGPMSWTSIVKFLCSRSLFIVSFLFIALSLSTQGAQYLFSKIIKLALQINLIISQLFTFVKKVNSLKLTSHRYVQTTMGSHAIGFGVWGLRTFNFDAWFFFVLDKSFCFILCFVCYRKLVFGVSDYVDFCFFLYLAEWTWTTHFNSFLRHFRCKISATDTAIRKV